METNILDFKLSKKAKSVAKQPSEKSTLPIKYPIPEFLRELFVRQYESVCRITKK